ncbi:MAG: hypothetical protein COB24_15155 [Hyphomicrobiales bacterium]|nr:MAG: hypothetical protein COB24_15155 [Hyphomicrobiales bacterium]
MANITVRDLPDQTKENLRVKAAQSGVSLEAYVRLILQTASASDRLVQFNVVELADKYFGGQNGVELELPSRATKRQEIVFE